MTASYCCEVEGTMEAKSSENPTMEYEVRGRVLSFRKPLVMGIVNLTPDSFYDGGKYGSTPDVLRDVESKLAAGAAIIDIGGASSRPGAGEVKADDEWDRVKGPLAAVRREFPEAFISVDTYRAAVALRAAEAGADIINDIGGGTLDPDMYDVVAQCGIPYLAMHMDGTPATMKDNPPYPDILAAVTARFVAVKGALAARGFSKLLLDPGFGFGKSLENNYRLLRTMKPLTALGSPIVAGLSRKSMITRVAGGTPVTALNGTSVLHTVALLNGATVLRAHDVPEAMQAIALVEFLKHA